MPGEISKEIPGKEDICFNPSGIFGGILLKPWEDKNKTTQFMDSAFLKYLQRKYCNKETPSYFYR